MKVEIISGKGYIMELDSLQDEPKLILTYPHKSKFNMISWLFMISLSLIGPWILNHLGRYHTDFADNMIIAIALIGVPILIYFMGYYLFINGVKLEVYGNDIVKYYTYGSRGQSVLCFTFKLEDIEQIKIKKRPFHCSKLTMKVRNPYAYGWHEKKLNKRMNVSVIADRKKSEFFVRQIEQFQFIEK